MRDDHHIHIMSTNSLLDITPNPLRYIYFSHDQNSGTLYQNKTHPPKTLNGTLLSYTNWSRIRGEWLKGRRGSWQISAGSQFFIWVLEGLGFFFLIPGLFKSILCHHFIILQCGRKQEEMEAILEWVFSDHQS